MTKKENGPVLNCSFCGKSQKEVRALIAGPNVYICNECLELCNDIMATEHGILPSSAFIKYDKSGAPSHLMIDVHTGNKCWVKMPKIESNTDDISEENKKAKVSGNEHKCDKNECQCGQSGKSVKTKA